MIKKKNNHVASALVGERIRRLRISKGLSQKELGSKVNLSQEMISKIENGKSELCPDYQIEFAKYFCVSNEYLLTGNESNLLELLNKYVSFKFMEITLDSDTVLNLPCLEIDKHLLSYLSNSARAKSDTSIPDYIRDTWIDKETEIFDSYTKSGADHEFSSFAPVPVNMIYSDSNDFDSRYIDLWKSASDLLLSAIHHKKDDN